MDDESLRDLVRREVGVIAVGLYEGITTGFGNARSSWARLNEPEYRWLLSMTTRARIRNHWDRNPLGRGWLMAGNAALMGQTILTSPALKIALRLLKENTRVHLGGVPPAGSNQARRLAWAQDPLPDLSLALNPKVTAQTTECLLLWNVQWEDSEPSLSIRVVHTTGPGRYGLRVPIDLSFAIEASGNMFEQLRFPGASQDELFFPDIDQKENEGDASGQ